MSTSLLKVAIQGDRASFHEIAAHAYYQQPIELAYCDTFEEVFMLLQTGSVDRSFVAVSNSAHGTIQEVEALIQQHNPRCEGSHDLAITQHLIGMPHATTQYVTQVVSHPVALSQCSLYLNGSLKDSKKVDYHDTSAAVAYIKERNDPTMAAIGSEAAAKLHGMHIIERAIQDDPNNTTRFTSFARQ